MATEDESWRKQFASEGNGGGDRPHRPSFNRNGGGYQRERREFRSNDGIHPHGCNRRWSETLFSLSDNRHHCG